MRTSVREDSSCSPAEMLYGAPLRLPGDSFTPSEPVPLAPDFARDLRSVIGSAAPMPVVHHGAVASRLDPALFSASHVFLRVDAVRRPLVPPYLGPFQVLERNKKTFIISQNDKRVTVTIDRLKPAFILPASECAVPSPTPTPASSSAPPAPVPAASGVPDLQDVSEFPPLRSGRVPRPVQRYQA